MQAKTKLKSFRDENLEGILPDDILLNVDQAALVLAVSASTLNHWRSDGKGPQFVRLAGRGVIRYRAAAIRAYIAANTFNSVAEADLASAMSRVSPFVEDWAELHPFVMRGAHFIVDSAVADRNTFVAVLTDPMARVRWLKPAQALVKLWLRHEKRLELVERYLKSYEGFGKQQEVLNAYQLAVSCVPLSQWGSHPDLTLQTLDANFDFRLSSLSVATKNAFAAKQANGANQKDM